MRADAARNRALILDATRRLSDRHGPGDLRIEAVAREAGVGKATVIRRFGDKAGLISALLGEEERRLQERIVRGPPPLGPGAPPLERAEEFLVALAKLYLRELDLVHASETAGAGARYRVGAYAAWRQHLTMLATRAGTGVEPELAAHLLLAPLAAESLAELRRTGREHGLPDGLRALARGLLS
jgi:AcrR family transcriptional regulator